MAACVLEKLLFQFFRIGGGRDTLAAAERAPEADVVGIAYHLRDIADLVLTFRNETARGVHAQIFHIGGKFLPHILFKQRGKIFFVEVKANG